MTGAHAVEVEQMVVYPAAIVADSGAFGVGQPVQIFEQLIQRLGLALGTVGQGGVQVVHIGLKVLIMVKVERVAADVGRESLVGIGQRGSW